MSRGSSSLGGGGFGGGHSGGHVGSSGVHHHGSSGNGLLTGLVIGSLLSSRRSSGSSSGGSSGPQYDPTQGGKYKRVKNTTATLVTSMIFLGLTVLFIVLSVVFRFDAVYKQTSATATGYDTKYSYYYTTYDFDIDGKHYSVESQVGWTKLENMEMKEYTEENIQTYYLGKQYDIYYKATDPYKIYEVEARGDMPSTNGLYIFFAVVMGIITLVIYFGGIHKYELDPEYAAREREAEKNKVVDGKRRCAYCGTLIDANLGKCPNCGSSQK